MLPSMPFAFNEPFGMPHRQHVRAPPRTPSPPPLAEPNIKVEDAVNEYRITCSPPSDWKATVDASIESNAILLEGKLHAQTGCYYEYETRSRAGIYRGPPSQHYGKGLELDGFIPPGRLLRGSAPSRHGWIALDDDESFVLDDGSLALVGKPQVPRPVPFRKRVTLPQDAELQKATSKPLGDGGGLLITVPRLRRRQSIPINVKRAERPRPAAAAPPPPSPRSTSSRPKQAKSTSAKEAPPAPPPNSPAAAKKNKDVSAGEYKAQHKKQAAARRAAAELSSADALRSLQVNTDGPVLAECDDDDKNVQSPREEVEEWVARADGTFTRSDSEEEEGTSAAEDGSWVKVQAREEEDLAYWGF